MDEIAPTPNSPYMSIYYNNKTHFLILFETNFIPISYRNLHMVLVPPDFSRYFVEFVSSIFKTVLFAIACISSSTIQMGGDKLEPRPRDFALVTFNKTA